MAYLDVKNLTKNFADYFAVNNLSFRLAKGQRLGILGPSGSGKTTLLRLISGLENVNAGEIVLDSKTISAAQLTTPPQARNIGMVFQSLGLWPHLTCAEHLALVLRSRLRESNVRKNEIERLLQLVQLADKTERLPGQLSGGERQRLALARALAQRPRLLLLDEPFAHVDEPLRDELSEVVIAALAVCGSTAIIVSHDGPHLATLCDEVAVMEAGGILQQGRFSDLYDSPNSISVARMTGPCFALKAKAKGLIAESAIGRMPLDSPSEGQGVICLRPEHIRLGNDLKATIKHSVFVSGRWRVYLEVGQMLIWMWSDQPMEPGATDIEFAPAPFIPEK